MGPISNQKEDYFEIYSQAIIIQQLGETDLNVNIIFFFFFFFFSKATSLHGFPLVSNIINSAHFLLTRTKVMINCESYNLTNLLMLNNSVLYFNFECICCISPLCIPVPYNFMCLLTNRGSLFN